MTMTLVMSMIYPSVLFFGSGKHVYGPRYHNTCFPFSRTERTLDNFYAITDRYVWFLIENGTYILCFCIVLFFLIRYSLARYTDQAVSILITFPGHFIKHLMV